MARLYVLSMVSLLLLLTLPSVLATSRVACNSGDHFGCIPTDGEGSCCAKVTVVLNDGDDSESIG